MSTTRSINNGLTLPTLNDYGSIFDHSLDSPVEEPHEWEIPENGVERRRSQQKNEQPDPKNRKSAVEWVIPALRNWSLPSFLGDLGRTLINDGVYLPHPDIAPSINGHPHQHRQTPAPLSWTDPSAPHWETEQWLKRLPLQNKTRFYQIELLDEPLIGAENYLSWAENMGEMLDQCNVWPIVGGGLEPVPAMSKFCTQWRQVNNHVWMIITANVSREIRRELCVNGLAWDARGTWSYLQGTCGGDLAMTRRSMQGIQDLLHIKYDDCSSLDDYLGRMLVCIRAIECNRQGREDNVWLWCQFILANLGREWDDWVSDLVTKAEDDSTNGDFLDSFEHLYQLLGVEETRRVRASRFLSRSGE
ncbi:hypothetical protein N7474_009379 [Penicillium riverlandense]|uniref:uncharacterized protein n=1 Tax=Penicillium riverlandense TaxID=1903569 RepID=UPI002547EF9C|nr:uncharacterized protein N7474_009379 [Penicillium riverlandense]KAJ5808110.1 hypothetical protein N7474_009379 [Penicillium riverlandense]